MQLNWRRGREDSWPDSRRLIPPSARKQIAHLMYVDLVYLGEAVCTLGIRWKRSGIKSAVSRVKDAMTTSLKLSGALEESRCSPVVRFVAAAAEPARE